MKMIKLVVLFFFIGSMGYAQNTPKLELNEETKLIEATYFHEDGSISQKGTFNLDRKLHGEWISYNKNGDIVAIGEYAKGVKTGKWLFWADNTLKEVVYAANAIAGVTETTNSEGIVLNN